MGGCTSRSRWGGCMGASGNVARLLYPSDALFYSFIHCISYQIDGAGAESMRRWVRLGVGRGASQPICWVQAPSPSPRRQRRRLPQERAASGSAFPTGPSQIEVLPLGLFRPIRAFPLSKDGQPLPLHWLPPALAPLHRSPCTAPPLINQSAQGLACWGLSQIPAKIPPPPLPPSRPAPRTSAPSSAASRWPSPTSTARS